MSYCTCLAKSLAQLKLVEKVSQQLLAWLLVLLQLLQYQRQMLKGSISCLLQHRCFNHSCAGLNRRQAMGP